MKLNTKTFLTISATSIGLIIILYLLSQNIFLNNYRKLEIKNTTKNIKRVLSSIDDDIDGLDELNVDWSGWDDTYEFIENVNEDYIESNLIDETFPEIRLNFLAFINSAGKSIFIKAFDLEEEKVVPPSKGLMKLVSPGSFLLNHAGPWKKQGGIVQLEEGIMIISSQPILDIMVDSFKVPASF